MSLLFLIFVLVFIISLLLVKYLNHTNWQALPSLLWRGFVGGTLGGLVGFVPLNVLFFPYMLAFQIFHFLFTPLWGMIFVLLIRAANGKSEAEMGLRDKVIVGTLLGFATGVVLAITYPYVLGHPTSVESHLGFIAVLNWLLFGSLAGAGTGIMSATLKSVSGE